MNHIIEALKLIWTVIYKTWEVFILTLMTIFFFIFCMLTFWFQFLTLICVYLAEVYCRGYEKVVYKLKNR